MRRPQHYANESGDDIGYGSHDLNDALDDMDVYDGADQCGPDALSDLLARGTCVSPWKRQRWALADGVIDWMDPEHDMVTMFGRVLGYSTLSTCVQPIVEQDASVQSSPSVHKEVPRAYHAPDHRNIWRNQTTI